MLNAADVRTMKPELAEEDACQSADEHNYADTGSLQVKL